MDYTSRYVYTLKKAYTCSGDVIPSAVAALGMDYNPPAAPATLKQARDDTDISQQANSGDVIHPLLLTGSGAVTRLENAWIRTEQ